MKSEKPAETLKKSEIKEENENKQTQYSYFQLFRFATTGEWALTVIGVFIASLGAMVYPIVMVLYGEITVMFADRIETPKEPTTKTYLLPLFGGGAMLANASSKQIYDALISDSLAFAYFSTVCAVVQLFTCTISINMVNYSAMRQISRIRVKFLRSVLRQDMAWFDKFGGGNFATLITDDLEKIKEGISEKIAMFAYLFSSFCICIIFPIFYEWKLALVVLSCTPLIILSTAFQAKIQSAMSQQELAAYSSAGDLADEVLAAIRTVIAFGGEPKEIKRYKGRMKISKQNTLKKSFYSGLSGGFVWALSYWTHVVAFWYSEYLIIEDRDRDDKEFSLGSLMVVLFCTLTAAQNIGMSLLYVETFSMARSAAAGIFSVIDRQSQIDSLSQKGLKSMVINGNIEFKNVHFRYPARMDVRILNGLNLKIKAGQTIALVGSSGCGKSTCLQLIQRLYDALDGDVLIEGIPIQEINVAWLRSSIGVVGQEPVLFAGTIAENIRFGSAKVTMESIHNAAKIANCHRFILNLPKGYDTVISESNQLSGGQKQRIAIARALVRNPKILLLDEATSALDPSSEKRVQDAIVQASDDRTTIIVSHHLSTITNADRIVFIDEGVVVEDGTHKELMYLRGFYYNLISTKTAGYVKKSKSMVLIDREKRRALSSIAASIHSEHELEMEREQSISEIIHSATMNRLIRLNGKEWPYILFGCISAIIMGSCLPAYAYLYGEFFDILSIVDAAKLDAAVNWLLVMFTILGFVAGFANFFQTFCLSIAGLGLTYRLREQVFEAILNQEMGWFDREENSVGALGARLSGDCTSVQGATGGRFGSILQSVATISIGVGMSLYYSWNLTLVTVVLVPLVLLAGFFESRYMAISNLEEKQAIEGGCQMAVEAISQIRTIASLGQEEYIIKNFVDQMELAEASCRTKIRYRGLIYSLGQVMFTLGYAICLGYGGILVAEEKALYKNVIKVSEALVFGSWLIGQTLAYAPNVSAAILSANRLLVILDRIPQYSNPLTMPKYKIEGNVKYTDLDFHYPTRPEFQVLRRLNLDIPAGQTVALVGPSGSGKSSCIQLLLRYYDPLLGTLNLDGIPTTEFPIRQLRFHIGLVSQEPVLFNRTIAENIAYGDNSRIVPLTEIIAAAEMANIHRFITSLPLGYETRLGKRATHLSGGQKQRIAIARALVRNPRILLLDEATSALDNQSESIVQEALDRARAGRTCITIAHRLTTIQNADLICVIKGGVVIEKGTHSQLMALRQTYAKLYEMQQVDDSFDFLEDNQDQAAE